MSTTTRLNIDLLDEGQRQKEATINNAFAVLDAVAHTVQVTTTVANLPSASSNNGALAIATDVGAGNETWLVYSNGFSWLKIVQINGGVVSA